MFAIAATISNNQHTNTRSKHLQEISISTADHAMSLILT
jgi:hypothetical protein